MKKKTKLPFGMLPASWGLKGKSRLVAEAEYYYEGEDLEKKLAVIDADNEDEAQIAELRIDLKNENIGKVEFEKKVAGIRKEPWVNVLELGVNPENAQAGYIELDWNDEFVLMLHNNGYTAQSDEEVVNKWFNDVCRTVLHQEKADLDYGLTETDKPATTEEQGPGDVVIGNNSKNKTNKPS
jgi:hypothetical protein